MVTRAVRNNAFRCVGWIQLQQSVERTPELEGARLLQILGFEKHPPAEHRVQRATGKNGGFVHAACQPRKGIDRHCRSHE